jgi:hypothetical protein
MTFEPSGGQTGRANLRAITNALPDIRVWVIIALFLLSWRILEMISTEPALLKEGAFMLLVGMIVGNGGLGAAVLWLFGGTKTGGEVMKAQNDAVIASGPALTEPVTGTVTTTATVTGLDTDGESP